MSEVLAGDFHILFASPEAVLNEDCRKKLLMNTNFYEKIIGIVVDEAHVVVKWYVCYKNFS